MADMAAVAKVVEVVVGAVVDDTVEEVGAADKIGSVGDRRIGVEPATVLHQETACKQLVQIEMQGVGLERMLLVSASVIEAPKAFA